MRIFGRNYTDQPPTITIAFANGTIESESVPIISTIRNKGNLSVGSNLDVDTNVTANASTNTSTNMNKSKIHKLCMIMDCEDYSVFSNAMEMHFIDMKEFTKAVNEANSISINDTEEALFLKWLSVITQKEITNKKLIDDACNEEEIFMAVSALFRQSEDKYVRQAYQRRQDEIYFDNLHIQKLNQRSEQAEIKIAQAEREIEQAEIKIAQAERETAQERQKVAHAEREIEQERQKTAHAERETEQSKAENERLRAQIEQLQAQLANSK